MQFTTLWSLKEIMTANKDAESVGVRTKVYVCLVREEQGQSQRGDRY